VENTGEMGMTYLLFVNGHYWECTRNNALAFTLWKDWTDKGFSARLKFVCDDDEEAFKWLVPPEALEEVRMVA
jgi:hypothetical protein